MARAWNKWIFAACAVAATVSRLAAQDEPMPLPAAAQPAAVAAPDWTLERVVLKDGKEYRGMVRAETPASIEFAEVHRPPGKPMYLVVRTIDRAAIDRLQRLSPAEQEVLLTRLEQHRYRTLVESVRMETLVLSHQRREGQLVWLYEGNWFSLRSTAAEAMTRRAIVRLEQIFTAYRQVLAPRWQSPARIRIQIYGASEPYQQALLGLGLAIKNPAVYLQDQNLILAGSNMNRFEDSLAAVARQHAQIRAQLDRMVEEAPARIGQLRETLAKNQVPAAERQRIVVAEQKKWEDFRREARRKMTALERANLEKFEVVAGQMFRRLAHEAFHAYLEAFVYPRMAYDVPRWLNEGLAQTFEAGLLEADTLRIDTPNVVALERLQADLAGDSPLPLAELIAAGSETFLSGHADDGQTVSRAYYYSWGLAYYLAFERGVLGSEALEQYLDPAQAGAPAVARFEKLVGMPLEQFEPQWRDAMLRLQSR
jgi:hypothetical protein